MLLGAPHILDFTVQRLFRPAATPQGFAVSPPVLRNEDRVVESAVDIRLSYEVPRFVFCEARQTRRGAGRWDRPSVGKTFSPNLVIIPRQFSHRDVGCGTHLENLSDPRGHFMSGKFNQLLRHVQDNPALPTKF